MPVLQAWVPSLHPWLEPLLLVLVLSPAAGVVSADSSSPFNWPKIRPYPKFLFDFSFLLLYSYHHLSNIQIWSLFLYHICFKYFDKCTFLHVSLYYPTHFLHSSLSISYLLNLGLLQLKIKTAILRGRRGSVVHFICPSSSFLLLFWPFFSLISHFLASN